MSTRSKSETRRKLQDEILRKTGTIALKIEIVKGNVNRSELCREVGVTPHTFETELSAEFPKRRLRLKIENFLKMRLFTDVRDFTERQTLIATLGFDPNTATREQLREYLQKAGVSLSRQTKTKTELVEKISTLCSKIERIRT